MSRYPRWADEKICYYPQPCAAGDGMIYKGEYIAVFWKTNTEAIFFHGDCGDNYDDEGNLIADAS